MELGPSDASELASGQSLSKLESATSAENKPPTRPVISSLIQLCGTLWGWHVATLMCTVAL